MTLLNMSGCSSLRENPSVGCQTEPMQEQTLVRGPNDQLADQDVRLPKSQDIVTRTYFTDCDMLSVTSSEASEYYVNIRLRTMNLECFSNDVLNDAKSCPRT